MILETERLILRPWREADAPTLFKYASDPRVGPWCGWKPHQDVADSLDVLRKVLIDEHAWAVTLKGNDEPIGCISVFFSKNSRPAGEPEIGYWLGVPFWGNGYAPEAVLAVVESVFLEGHRNVWCAHFEENDRSRRVIEKCGFIYQFTEPWKSIYSDEAHISRFYRLSVREREPLSI